MLRAISISLEWKTWAYLLATKIQSLRTGGFSVQFRTRTSESRCRGHPQKILCPAGTRSLASLPRGKVRVPYCRAARQPACDDPLPIHRHAQNGRGDCGNLSAHIPRNHRVIWTESCSDPAVSSPAIEARYLDHIIPSL